MRVLREGGEYLQRRERLLWCYLVGGSAVLVSLGLVLILSFGQWLAMFAIPPALALVTLVATPLQRVRKGRLGERLVTDLLRELPDTRQRRMPPELAQRLAETLARSQSG